jgi:hypothetical protein
MYSGNASLLAESLESIQHTSSLLLAAIRPEDETEPAEISAAH